MKIDHNKLNAILFRKQIKYDELTRNKKKLKFVFNDDYVQKYQIIRYYSALKIIVKRDFINKFINHIRSQW